MKRFFLIVSLFLLFPAAVHAAGVELVAQDDSGAEAIHFFPFGEDYRGTGSFDAVDLGTDGVQEIIVGSGPGLPPEVKIFRQDGSLINEFLAYAETFQNGINVAACDVNGDGEVEIVTGTMFGGGPHIRIFSPQGYLLYGGGFFAYDGDFRGGVNVACGDIDGDGIDDIVTGPGTSGGPHVKVFDPLGNLKYEIFAGSASEATGASVAVGDLNGDGDDEIIFGRAGAGDASVMTFDLQNDRLRFVNSLLAFDENQNGIHVASADINHDGRSDIIVSTNKDAVGLTNIFDATGIAIETRTPFSSEEEKGLVSSGISINGSDQLLSLSTTPRENDRVGKYIHVDVSEQKLYAYQNGSLVNSFLVSTGTYAFPTPLGITAITDKLPVHDYVWSYGPNNPNNYNLPDVKWNLRFRQHFYIHSAYWHNNFGHRMSHGCVNTSVQDAEWIFNWADVGTLVEISE